VDAQSVPDPEEELLDSNVVMRLPEQTVEQMS